MTDSTPLALVTGGGHGDEGTMTFALIWYALAAMALLPTIVLLGLYFSGRKVEAPRHPTDVQQGGASR